MGKITKKSISLILVLSLLISLAWVPKPVYAANVFQSIGDYLGAVDDWLYDTFYGWKDKKAAKYYSDAMPVQPQANYIDSNNTYNEYVYAGGNTYYYTPITTNNNQSYRYYDIDNKIYRTTNNYEYSPTYNMYHMTYEDNDTTYNYYMQDNYTYISYIIECPENPNENKYFEVYYELPDGRNSYNLRPEDLRGIVFTYDVDLYDKEPLDDNLIGLWHLDGNINDSFNPNNNIQTSANVLNDFYDGYYDGALKVSGSNSYITFNVEGNLNQPFTLEWIEYGYNDSVQYTDWTNTIQSRTYYFIVNKNKLFGESLSKYVFYALCFDGNNYSLYVNGVKDNSFSFNYRVWMFQGYDSSYNRIWRDYYKNYLDITSNSITFSPKIYSQEYSEEAVNSYRTYCYYEGYHLSYLIDEVRLSSGVLYTENYNVRREPFDVGYAFVVPSNPESGTIYVQSLVPVSEFQIGGVRSGNPKDGEVFISTSGSIGVNAIQYFNGVWNSVNAAIYYEDEFKSISGFDFVNMMFVSGESASGGSYVVEMPEEVTSLLEKIDQKLASILNPLKPVDDVTAIPFKDPGTDEEMQSFHLSDFFILLVYFILFANILGDFVSTFVKLTDWVYHLWAIEALPGPLAGNEYFMGVWTILHGGTAFGLPEPIKIFGVVSLHDFMVMLFEIAFIGLMVAFYRKKLVNLKFPTLR